MIQVSDSNNNMRETIASVRPKLRALACCAVGSLLTRMLINTILSMPSTASRTVKVARAIQLSGEETQFIFFLLDCDGRNFDGSSSVQVNFRRRRGRAKTWPGGNELLVA